MRIRMIPRTESHNGHASTYIGCDDGHKVYLANPEDRAWQSHRTVFWFGACGPTYVLAYGRSFDDALETAAEYALDRWPGLGCGDAVSDEYNRQIADGVSEDDAAEFATVDTYSTGDGRYLASDDWGYSLDCPDREDLENFCYDPGGCWDDPADGCRVKRPEYRPTRRDYRPTVAPTESQLWSDVVMATIHSGRSVLGTNAILAAIGDM